MHFSITGFFQQIFYRRNNQCERRTYLMGNVDKKAQLHFSHFLAAFALHGNIPQTTCTYYK